MAHLRLTALLFFLAAACTPAPAEPPPPTPAPAPAPTVELGFPNGRLGRLDVPHFEVSMALPDRARWTTVDEPASSFVVLDHVPTSSRLVLRLWSESEVVSREACEARARSLRELPAVDGGAELLGAPEGFDTAVSLGVLGSAPGAPLRGYLLAFGAAARRCLAFVFTTEAQGPEAERRVAERLAMMEEITLKRMRVKRDLTSPRE